MSSMIHPEELCNFNNSTFIWQPLSTPTPQYLQYDNDRYLQRPLLTSNSSSFQKQQSPVQDLDISDYELSTTNREYSSSESSPPTEATQQPMKIIPYRSKPKLNEKEQKRREQNRRAQAAYRARSDDRVRALQDEVASLAEQKHSLLQSCDDKDQEIAQRDMQVETLTIQVVMQAQMLELSHRLIGAQAGGKRRGDGFVQA